MCFLGLFLFLPTRAMAWGMLGHRIVGEIADSYLTAKARAKIKAILGNESIAMASNWADFIKSDRSYAYLSNWHYVDLDKPYTYPELHAFLKSDTSTNAYTRINFLTAQLKKSGISQSEKVMYLRLLIHIAEDIHQPFHVGHTDDQGGNGFKVNWFNKPINMHSLWDSELIESQQLSYTEYARAINFTTPAERASLWKEDLTKWIYDSHIIVEKLYTDVKPDDKLGYRYNFDHLALLNQQLLKGGVHLAGLLNQVFGG
ncbi:S1/P1 Nuclease [Pedobacter sp. HMF7056]|uniref:S1/P1 Nuclease n=2 Tax=Hufsiella ginkgonis TaxID=2695274 RepID=A0A7K1XUF5_9SPHI|nr:S1/P1 Nuclease [Hufsiella ginkgonis]